MHSHFSMQTIWDNYHRALKVFLHSKLNNPDDVDDLLQNIMIKVQDNLSTLKKEGSLKSWLFTLTHRAIMDYYRQQKKESHLHAQWQEYDVLNTQDQHVLEQCITPFIQALPDAQRDLLMAVDLENQPQHVIAEQQGIPYSTLKSRVKKGRDGIRTLFENCCHLSFDHRGHIIDCHKKSQDSNGC